MNYRMKFPSKYILLIASILLSIVSYAIPDKPYPPRLVNDYADIFTSAQEARLEEMLVAFDDSTSNQIAVVTVKDLEGYDASEFATRIGLEWQVGSDKFDNGIVLLVKPKTRESSGQVFIAVGYGLEGAIPDAYAKRIIDSELIPNFIDEDYYAGVESACEVLMKLASGEISEPDEIDEILSFIIFICFIGLLIFFALIISSTKNNDGGSGNGGRTIYIGPIITTGRSYGGGFSSGGGFGGGFGGFGGGSFGGGGAGGSW